MVATSPLLTSFPASDPNLASRISADFFHSGYGPLRAVSVMANGGVVTLKGRVPTYYLKQLAQHRAIRVPGVIVVENQIQVD